jgi:putative peptidoglycan lipid II flippase
VSPRSRAAAGLAGAAASIAALTLLARVVGFGRWLAFSGTVGSSCVGAAYSTANLVPNVLFEVVAGGALAAAVVPVLSGSLVRGDRVQADRTASALLTWTVLVLAPLSLLLALVAGPVARLLLGPPGCAGQLAAATTMLALFAPQVVLYGVGVVLTGVLQAHRRFVGPALAPLVSSLVVVAVYLLFARVTDRPPDAATWLPGAGPRTLLALGTTAGVLVLSLPLLVPVARAGVRLRPTLRLDAGLGGTARGLAVAGVAALLAQQLLVLVTARLANLSGGVGAINVYQYVQAVYLLPYAVLAVPLATAVFPTLSALAAAGRAPDYAATLTRSTRVVVLVATLGAGVLVAVAPAVGGLFAALDVGGRLPAVQAMPQALTAFAPGLLGFALIAHLGRALYAAGATRAAARATVTGWLVATAGSVLLVPVLLRAAGAGPRAGAAAVPTLVGLGAASSLGMTVAGVLLLVSAGRVRVAGQAAGLVGAVPASARVVGWTALGVLAGRWTVDAVLRTGAGWAIMTGVIGAAVTSAVVLAGLALTDRADLQALARRRVG